VPERAGLRGVSAGEVVAADAVRDLLYESSMTRTHLGLAALLVTLVTVRAAHADVPPPAGQKAVSYTFTLRGLPESGDPMIVAYPCGTSGGAPDDVLLPVAPGARNTVGRRGGECVLYATSRSAYDAWAKGDGGLDGGRESKRAFVAAARKCTGGPTPTFYISASDGRSSVDEVLDVTRLDAEACTVTSTNPPAAGGETGRGTDSGGAGDGGAAGAGKSGGCAVSAPGDAGGALYALGGLGLVALVARRRRTRS